MTDALAGALAAAAVAGARAGSPIGSLGADRSEARTDGRAEGAVLARRAIPEGGQGGDGEAVLARLGGPLGAAARAAFAELAALAPSEQRTRRAGWAAAVRAPIPAGVRGAHPSWIEHGLAACPARAREALATGATDPVAVWLARWACAELPPLPAPDAAITAPRSLADAVRMPGAALAVWLERVALDQLALAFEAAGPDALRAGVARLGAGLEAAAARVAAHGDRAAFGPRRAAIERCRVAPDDPHALLAIAARSLAPHVDALARRQLAARLPRPAGLVVLRELSAHADAPVERAPTWAALGG